MNRQFLAIFLFSSHNGTNAFRANRGQVYALLSSAFANGTKKFRGWAGSNGKRYDDGVLVFDLAGEGSKVLLTAIWE